MIADVVWTEHAARDYQNLNTSLATESELSYFLELAKAFPEIGFAGPVVQIAKKRTYRQKESLWSLLLSTRQPPLRCCSPESETRFRYDRKIDSFQIAELEAN